MIGRRITAIESSGSWTAPNPGLRFAAGFGAWFGGLALLPAPLAARILLLAPLVIVPRLLAVTPPRPAVCRLAGWPAFAAGLVLVAAFAVPAGPAAAILASPWLLVGIVAAGGAVAHGIPRLGGIVDPSRWPELGVDAALGFLAVGAAFVVVDRLGLGFMGFSPAIILLTATHFHFAAFGLLAIASLHAGRRRGLAPAVLGLVVGVPLTALGFIAPSPVLGAVGAVVVGASGMAVGIALLLDRAGLRAMHALAGAALLVAMPMAIAWSVAILVGAQFLDLDAMVRTHGALNATAVLLASFGYRAPGS